MGYPSSPEAIRVTNNKFFSNYAQDLPYIKTVLKSHDVKVSVELKAVKWSVLLQWKKFRNSDTLRHKGTGSLWMVKEAIILPLKETISEIWAKDKPENGLISPSCVNDHTWERKPTQSLGNVRSSD